MRALTVSNVKFSELLSKVLEGVKPRFLQIGKSVLEEEQKELRDRSIHSGKYVRGNIKKRWGYTVRKCIQTPLGEIEQVRILQIREVGYGVSLFCDGYIKRSEEMTAVMLEMFVWGVSSRCCSVLSQKLFSSGLSANGICL